VSLDKVMEAVAFGSKNPAVLSSLAAKLARLDRRLEPEIRQELQKLAGGQSVSDIVAGLVRAIDPDAQVEAAKSAAGARKRPPNRFRRPRSNSSPTRLKPILSNTEWRTRLPCHQAQL